MQVAGSTGSKVGGRKQRCQATSKKDAAKETKRQNIDAYIAEQLDSWLGLITARMQAQNQESSSTALIQLLRTIQKLCSPINDVFRQQLRGRYQRFQNYQARDHTADKPVDDPDLSDGDEVICVFSESSPAERFSDVLRVGRSRQGPALYAALAKVEDLRVREPRVKKRLAFVSRASWQDSSLLITPLFFTPALDNGSHRRLDNEHLLAYELPLDQSSSCNQVVDASTFMLRVGMNWSEQHQLYYIEEGWEQDVLKLLTDCRKAGGRIPGRDNLIPAQPRMLASDRKKRTACKGQGSKGRSSKLGKRKRKRKV